MLRYVIQHQNQQLVGRFVHHFKPPNFYVLSCQNSNISPSATNKDLRVQIVLLEEPQIAVYIPPVLHIFLKMPPRQVENHPTDHFRKSNLQLDLDNY